MTDGESKIENVLCVYIDELLKEVPDNRKRGTNAIGRTVEPQSLRTDIKEVLNAVNTALSTSHDGRKQQRIRVDKTRDLQGGSKRYRKRTRELWIETHGWT